MIGIIKEYKYLLIIWILSFIVFTVSFVYIPITYVYSYLYWNSKTFSVINFHIIFLIYNLGCTLGGIFINNLIKNFGYSYSIFLINLLQGITLILLSYSSNQYMYFIYYMLFGCFNTSFIVLFSKITFLLYPKYFEKFNGLTFSILSLNYVFMLIFSLLIINPNNDKPIVLYKEGTYTILLFNKIISINTPKFIFIFGIINIIICLTITIFLNDPINTDFKNKYPNAIFNNKNIVDDNNLKVKILKNNHNNLKKDDNLDYKFYIALKSKTFLSIYLSYSIFSFGYIHFTSNMKHFGFEFYSDHFVSYFSSIGFCIHSISRIICSIYISKKNITKILFLGQLFLWFSIIMRVFFNNAIFKFILCYLFLFLGSSIFYCGFLSISNIFFDSDISNRISGMLNSVFLLASIILMALSKLRSYLSDFSNDLIILFLFLISLFLLFRLNK